MIPRMGFDVKACCVWCCFLLNGGEASSYGFLCPSGWPMSQRLEPAGGRDPVELCQIPSLQRGGGGGTAGRGHLVDVFVLFDDRLLVMMTLVLGFAFSRGGLVGL